MKKIFSLIAIGLLCFAAFSVLTPTARTESNGSVANPVTLVVIPDEIEVTLTVMDRWLDPRVDFQLGERVDFMLEWTLLSGGNFSHFAVDVVFVVTDEQGNAVWSYSEGPLVPGGYAITATWHQVDESGSSVQAGNYAAGVIFAEPAYDILEDFSGVVPFTITDGTSVFVHSDQDLGSNSLAAAVGDIDDDGDLDILLGNGTNKVYRNDGVGSFMYDYSFGISGHGHAKSLRLGDLDGDGDLDVIDGNLGYRDAPAEIRMYENGGDGDFAYSEQIVKKTPSSFWDNSQFIELADINNDGDLDIIISLTFSNSIEIFVNDAGDFAKSQTLYSPIPKGCAVGDIDNDEDLDFVTANSENYPNRVFQNNGHGIFTDTGQTLGAFYTYSVALGDIDNDGDLDLAAGNIAAANEIYVNDGNGVFTLSYAFGAVRGYSHPVVFGDIDNDNDLDLITGGDRTYVYLNDGAGQFDESEHSLVGTGGLNGDVALADIDNDRDLDLITAGYWNKLYINTVSVPTHKVAYVAVRYNDDTEPDYTINELKERADRITDYYLQQSFEEMNIGNEFVFDDWRRLSKSYSEYEQEYPDNWIARFGRIREDAIQLSGINTRDYDAVVVVQSLNMRSFALRSARKVITTEDTPCTGGHAFSVWAHEIGHAIPDLAWYDYYRDPVFVTSGGIGCWGLMGRGTLMNPTAPVISYNKADAGWLEYNTIESDQYGEYPVDLLMNLDYGENVYRYEAESGDVKYYIFEGRHPPDGVEKDPEWNYKFKLKKDCGILIYELTNEGKLYTLPHGHSQNDRVTLLPGDSLPRVDSGVQFAAKKIDSQLFIEIEELESTEITIVSLSTVAVTIDGAPIAESEIEPDVDLHLYTPDGRHVGMNYESGEYLLQIEGAESSGNILAGGPEWIAVPDNMDFYIAVDPTPTRQWIEEDPLIPTEDVTIDATVKLIHYDENAIRRETSPVPLDIDVERPTILTRANVTKTFKPSEISARRRGAVMSRTSITNTGHLNITEINYEDEILDSWSLRDFDHTISATLFINDVKYKIPYEELDYVAAEYSKYKVYINFTSGVDLYQFNETSGMEEHKMTIYAFERKWVLEIKYPMFPPKGLPAGNYKASVSVRIVGPEDITVTADDTAALRVN